MYDDSELAAAIWKIDRFAIHDGPGIRTNIYFKGCPLRCLWCSNPEGQRQRDEIGYSEAKCVHCGSCATVCPKGAIALENGAPVPDLEKCDACGECAAGCPSGALFVYGRLYDIAQIMDIVERDRHVYRRSGGGITCTGGEACSQPAFLLRLLKECRRAGVPAAVETCGFADREDFRKILDEVDWLFFDLKHLDPVEHKKLTGVDNSLILENLRAASSVLAERGKTLVIRQVVVPGVNDGENIEALARTAAALPRVDFVELLPYHAYGTNKYATLWRPYRLDGLLPPEDDVLREQSKIIEKAGVRCSIGGS